MTALLVADICLFGMALDLLGGCFLAYDLLGQKGGPLRTTARALTYFAIFFLGYFPFLGIGYALIASVGMGGLLSFEYQTNKKRVEPVSRKSFAVLLGLLRGVILALAGSTLGGWIFGGYFGLFSGVGLSLSYLIGFSPSDDYAVIKGPRLNGHKLVAALLRTFVVGAAGVVAAYLAGSGLTSLSLGLRVGLVAGLMSAIVGTLSPVIEWWVENVSGRSLGIMGIFLILAGSLLQSVQYLLVEFKIPIG